MKFPYRDIANWFGRASLFVGLTVVLFAESTAQGVELDDFSVFQHDNEIYLSWVIAKGNSCNGISIERSNDDVHYAEIEYIPGVCGSPSYPQPFSFIDEHPLPNEVNYYRLELGLQGYSETRQLEFIRIDDSGFQLRPNPASDQTLILFNNSRSQQFDVEIYSLTGALMERRSSNTSDILLDVSHFNGGVYMLQLINRESGKTYSGRLVVTGR